MMKANKLGLSWVIVLCLIAATALACPPGTLRWLKHVGTPSFDLLWEHIATDAVGNVAVSGRTDGNLRGAHQGQGDAFVAVYGPAGGRRWVRQLGTPKSEISNGVAFDGGDRSVAMVMQTYGTLFAPFAGGKGDIALAKFDSAGNFLWGQQFGTSGEDSGEAIAVDDLGNIVIGGHTEGALFGDDNGWLNAWIAKFDRNGNLVWGRQFGNGPWELVWDITFDDERNIVVSGHTHSALFGPHAGSRDAFFAKFSQEGDLIWGRQFGTSSSDTASSVKVGLGGTLVVAGGTDGALAGPNLGGTDAFVIKFNADGTRRLWSKQIGTANSDGLSRGLAVDQRGNVIVGGTTNGALAGPHQGGRDGWVIKFGANGDERWARQIGTGADDEIDGITTDAKGFVLISGTTRGSLGGVAFGDRDGWVAKYAP